jgi:hypothetical protein
MITLTSNIFNSNNYWTNASDIICDELDAKQFVSTFDQNGYDLTLIEQMYVSCHNVKCTYFRDRVALATNWFEQSTKEEGAILNHSYIFHRRSFKDKALEQVQAIARHRPIMFKLVKLRAKWGLDFSIDWVDSEGNVCEILHWEWDSFNLDHVQDVKYRVDNKLINVDWDDAGRQMIIDKDKWHHLSFFEQSDWKCNYFGIPKEQFKMVSWE